VFLLVRVGLLLEYIELIRLLIFLADWDDLRKGEPWVSRHRCQVGCHPDRGLIRNFEIIIHLISYKRIKCRLWQRWVMHRAMWRIMLAKYWRRYAQKRGVASRSSFAVTWIFWFYFLNSLVWVRLALNPPYGASKGLTLEYPENWLDWRGHVLGPIPFRLSKQYLQAFRFYGSVHFKPEC
jgi:hypothetical protein